MRVSVSSAAVRIWRPTVRTSPFARQTGVDVNSVGASKPGIHVDNSGRLPTRLAGIEHVDGASTSGISPVRSVPWNRPIDGGERTRRDRSEPRQWPQTDGSGPRAG